MGRLQQALRLALGQRRTQPGAEEAGEQDAGEQDAGEEDAGERTPGRRTQLPQGQTFGTLTRARLALALGQRTPRQPQQS